MALKFAKLTRPAVRGLAVGARITEHGISVVRNANGDVTYSVQAMVDGARINRVVGKERDGVTREQAERTLETLRTRAREGRLMLPKGRKTVQAFTDAARAYIVRLEAENGKSVERKRRHIDMRLSPAFGSYRIDGLDESAISRFVVSRRVEGAKNSTINRELATLSHLLRCAVRRKWVDPSKVPVIERLKEGAGRIVALSPEECQCLLDAAASDQDPDLWLFVMVCLQTSMRHGEARRLKWEHFDVHRRRFYIPEAKAGQREQPVPSGLAEALVQVMRNRSVSSGYVFVGGPGSSTGYRHTFRKAFQRAVCRAGFDPETITPHVMRHTAITKLVKAGVDLPTVQKVSGHKTYSMVLRYTHIDGVHIDKAVDHLSLA